MTVATVRVLVVDDHPIVLDGVTLAFQSTSWLSIAGYARSGREAITSAQSLRPGVVLLDLRLPDMLAPEVITGLRAQLPDLKIIVFTAYPDHTALDAALGAGANAVVVKDADRADLVEIVRRVVDGERIVCDGTAEDGSTLLRRKLRESGLTPREYDILRHVAMGKTNPQIADSLGLTRNTVKTYLQRTLEKLGAHNRIEALSRASERGIL